MGYYDGSGSASGAGTDYGYIGGGFYIPTPYVAPPTPPPKPKAVTKPIAGGVNYGQPVYHDPSAAANQPVNWSAPSPAQRQQTAIANGVQIAGVNAPSKKKTAQTAITNTAASSGGGGSSGGGSGSGFGVSVNPTQAAATTPDAPAAAPEPTTRDVFIPNVNSDTQYLDQVGQLAKALTDADTARDTAISQYGTSWNDTVKNLGYDQGKKEWMRDDPLTQYGGAARGNVEDFGGRGMLNSSFFSDSLGNMNRDFNNQFGQLNTAKTNFGNSQDDAYTQYATQNTAAKQAAQQAAISRIAGQYGVDIGQVPTTGTAGKTVTVPIAAS